MKILKETSEPSDEQQHHMSLLEFIKGYFVFLYKHFIRP